MKAGFHVMAEMQIGRLNCPPEVATLELKHLK